MIDQLSEKNRRAIARASQNDTLRDVLLRKAKGTKWLLAFKEAGFLDPQLIPPPRPSDQEGFIVVPFWPITDFLVSIREQLTSQDNRDVAEEVLRFIRDSTAFAKSRGFGNFRVWWQFARIMPHMPRELIEKIDLENVDYWLSDRYDTGLIVDALGKEWLSALIDSRDARSAELALGLIDAIYTVSAKERPGGSAQKFDAVLRFGDWYADRLTDKIAFHAGRTVGFTAVELFRSRMEKALEIEGNDKWSSIWRPAIEEHDQNLSTPDSMCVLVEAYRDSLLGFLNDRRHNLDTAIEAALESKYSTTLRIAIYAIDKCFADLHSHSKRILLCENYSSNLRHELWHFLRNHFSEINDDQKHGVLQCIESMKVEDGGKANDAATAYRRATWLAAIKAQPEASALFEHYKRLAGGEPEHPDFSSYRTSGWVQPKSPYSVEDLQKLEATDLVALLKSFKDPRQFGEPGIEGLVRTFRSLIEQEPLRFLDNLDLLLTLDPAYLYELVEAYSRSWTERKPLPWDRIWPALLDFAGKLTEDELFWTAEHPGRRDQLVASRDAVVQSIAYLFESGARSDDHSYPPSLQPMVENLIERLLDRQAGDSFESESESDAVDVAINSPRGRILDALITVSLKKCRMAEAANVDRASAWHELEHIFDSELAAPSAANYEFRTLVAHYLPQILWMSTTWVHKNLDEIFDDTDKKGWLCAMQGYGYVNHVYQDIYAYLKEHNHLQRALDEQGLKDETKNKLVQHIAVAYLNGFETLEDDSSLINLLLSRKMESELSQLIWFLWSIAKEEAKFVEKSLLLWPRIVSKLDKRVLSDRKIGSRLCDWISFIETIDDKTKALIKSVLPFAGVEYNAHEVLENIARFSELQPKEAGEIWLMLLDETRPSYPEDAIRKALTNILAAGSEGLRMAKEIVWKYVEVGVDFPNDLLRSQVSEYDRDKPLGQHSPQH